MKYFIAGFLVLVFLTIACNSSGPTGPPPQPGPTKVYQREWSPWTVTESGVPLELPYLGGFNEPQPIFVDFDGDSLIDLMIGQTHENYKGALLYLRNTGNAILPQWTPVSEQLGGIDIGTWYTMSDIDADGDYDIFCDSRTIRMNFYENIIEESGGPFSGFGSAGKFAKEIFRLSDSAYGGFVVGINNTPSFADIDSDGDLDYFYGIINGRLEFHRNDGDSANANFVYVTSAYDSVCATCLSNPPPLVPTAGNHGFSSISFADFDGDQDMDLFWGDNNNPNLYLFQNYGTSYSSDLNLVTQNYLPISTSGFNRVSYADIDGDTDYDMIVGVGQLADIDNLHLLRNTGSKQFPNFISETSNYISQIDVGRDAMPAFEDMDNDGDIDMIVGGSNGQLAYYENVGSANNPSFNRITEFYGSIDVGTYSSPAIVDWDRDGDLDMLIGNALGRIEYWRNDGSPTNFAPTLANNSLASIKVNFQSIPFPVDLNDDGLIDLVVGEWHYSQFANVRLYMNIDTVGSVEPALQLVTDRLLKRETRAFTLPVFYDWNEDGRKDLILGRLELGLQLYLNSAHVGEFPDSMTLTLVSEELPINVVGQALKVNFIDIDNDGDDDVFIGEKGGGVNFFRRLE